MYLHLNLFKSLNFFSLKFKSVRYFVNDIEHIEQIEKKHLDWEDQKQSWHVKLLPCHDFVMSFKGYSVVGKNPT